MRDDGAPSVNCARSVDCARSVRGPRHAPLFALSRPALSVVMPAQAGHPKPVRRFEGPMRRYYWIAACADDDNRETRGRRGLETARVAASCSRPVSTCGRQHKGPGAALVSPLPSARKLRVAVRRTRDKQPAQLRRRLARAHVASGVPCCRTAALSRTREAACLSSVPTLESSPRSTCSPSPRAVSKR